MEKNPDLSFAIDQSFPFQSIYPGATPLGPIIEIESPNQPSALTAERAAEAVDYWRTAAQQFSNEGQTAESLAVRDAYAKMAGEQGALFLDRNYTTQAEEAFRIANEISPGNAEAVLRYVSLLKGQERTGDAILVLENAMKAAPDNQQFRQLADYLRKEANK